MGCILDKVVPWGRSYGEYVKMFNLTESDLSFRILGCGDGPAGFNAGLTKHNGNIISVDPVYSFNAGQIRQRIAETREIVLAQVEANRNDYVWDAIPSVEELGRVRMSAMNEFLLDFEKGKAEGRYVAAELPDLPFERGEFDLALSSHFLLLYSQQLSAEFHRKAVSEMLRVAREIRIFPLVTLDGKPSPHLVPITASLKSSGFSARIVNVPYEFQRGGNEMLVVKPRPLHPE